jgi:hypothetical protein
MAQKWHDLLFAHWPVEPAALRKQIPEKLSLDTFQGQAWIGIVPFTMSGVRLRGIFSLPWLSAFPELNVRTYVIAGGKPGVWFFSLDAGNRVAVEIARRWFYLPYFCARMKSATGPEGIAYCAQREDRRGNGERFQATYSASGANFVAVPGSLEYFLTERYCLYAQRPDGAILQGEIHHPPWDLQEARATFRENTMTKSLGMKLSEWPAVLHFSKLQDVVVWPPKII